METEELLAWGQEILLSFGVQLLTAIAIFVIGRWVAKGVTGLIRKAMARYEVDHTLERFLGNLVYAVLLTFVVLAAIGELGIQTTSVIAVIGAAGLAIGLALQGSLANFAAGVLIILFRPYKVGDFVEGAGVAGSIDAVQIFTTVLKTGDNKKIIVPNSEMLNGVIVNYSAHPTRRIDMTVGVGYDDDLDKVKTVLREILNAEPRVLDDPAPTIAVAELADSSVNFVVRPWVKTADYWPVQFDLTETIKKRFDQEAISIPYPQSDVHLYQQQSDT